MADDRWIEVTASQFDHEREGLEYLHERLPQHSPFRVWTNFEFRDTRGGWHEVDALLLGQDALYLLELKHFYGAISGNDRTWTRNGRTENSPLLLARRKAQLLASKLKAVYEEIAGRNPQIPTDRLIPWVQEAVFLHHRETRVLLPEQSRIKLYGLDELEGSPVGLPGISNLFDETTGRRPIDPQQEDILVQLLERIGLVQRREREVGSWVIVEGGAIAEGDGWQDWEASGKETGAPARIRFLTHTSDEERRVAELVANHEFEVMRRLNHDGLIRPIDIVSDNQLGRGLVYDWDKNLQRLDLWLEEHRDQLDLAQRLQIIREVGEVLDYAHGRGLVHRSLTPHTIWIGDPVTPGGPLAVKVSDWQAAGSTRDAGSKHGVTKHAAQATADDAENLAFAAPEGTWSASGTDRTGLDQFSLGAIAYYLFAGTAPAATPQELLVRLREQSGLDLAVDIPEVPSQIRDAIRQATSPAPKDRHETIRDFLTELDRSETVVVDEDLDPRDARAGDVLADGRFTVKKRLGKGSTALGLLVEDSTVTTQNKDRVLKIALDEKAIARLAEEADVLKKVKSRRIASLLEGPLDLGGTTALLLESAGEDSMRDVLRGYGNGLPVDLLDRYGDDLLEALEVLDRLGIDHRDVKPANIGVVRDSSKIWHVKLFDFSLSRAPAAEIDAGTAPYLDPFLGDPDRGLYDSAAERYAAAVVLYEMATGTHPQYGDDPQANPAAIADEITLSPDDFAQGLGTDLTAFFRRALARRAKERFGTVLEMRAAWKQMFGDATSTAPSGADELAAGVTLATPLAEAGLSPRALSWFTGKDLHTVRDVVELDSLQLSRMNGLTKVTREEVRTRAKEWRNRFSDVTTAARRTSGQLPAIEDIVEMLFTGLKERRSELPRTLLEMILGGQGNKHVDPFAPQVVLGAMLGAGTPQVNQALIDMHEDWSKDEKAGPALAEVARTVDETLDVLGGVAGTAELVATLLEESGAETASTKRDAELRRRTEGLLRLVVDGRRHRRRAGDDILQPLDERRRHERVVALARSGDLLDLAIRLEDAVNGAVESLNGVLATARSRDVVAPLLDTLDADSPLAAGHRALRLGAALTRGLAAVSSTGELHRRDLPAPDALRIALGDLSTDARMSPKVLQERVATRFSQLPPLPGRPQLDSLVSSAGLALRFDDDSNEYVGPTIHGDTTMLTQRPATVTGANRALQEDTATTRRLEESRRRRSYLVLGTIPSRLGTLEQALENRFAVRRLGVATLLLDEMRRVLASNPGFPSWDVIVQADGKPEGSREHQAVSKVVELAMPAVTTQIEEQLAADDAPADDRAPLILTDVDVLVRYGQAGQLRRLSDLTVARDRGVWVVVPQYQTHTGPAIDGVQLTTSPHQFLDVDYAWSDTFAKPVIEDTQTAMEDAP